MNSSFLRSNILLLLVLVVQVVGFGVLWGRNSEPETIFIPTGISAGTGDGRSIPVTAIKLPDAESLRASVRSVLQEELRAYVQQASGRANPREAESARVAKDPKGNAEAFAQSSNVIDQALGKRTWSKEDNVALLQHMDKLSEAQRLELTQKFHNAINRQELKILGPPPL